MRWLLALLLLVASTGGSPVDARLVIREPPMVRRCPRFQGWNQVIACLSQHYTARVTREVKGAKLVTLYDKTPKAVDSGALLYVQRDGGWQIGGQLETYGGEYVVLGLVPVTIGTHSGFRLDLGQIIPTSIMVDATPVPATQRLHRALFCNGDSYSCPEVTVACDVFVAGNAWYVFRGTLTYEDNAVVVTGDRDRARPHCDVSPKVFLGWAR